MRNGSKRSLELFTNEVIIIIKLLIFSYATKEIFKPIIFRFSNSFKMSYVLIKMFNVIINMYIINIVYVNAGVKFLGYNLMRHEV